MSTVKISDLPVISAINANTANTVIVGLDIPTNITGRMTLTTLATGLYSNNVLVVGNNFTILPNVAGQFTGNSAAYVQVNLENQIGNGSGDIVVTADTGTDSDYYIDMGFNGSTYNYPGYTFAKPLDGYLVVQGSNTAPTLKGGNLVIGTTTTGKDITFTQGSFDESGRVAQFIYNTGFKLLKKPLIFADGTSQNSAVAYTGVDSRVSSNISAANAFTQSAFDKANTAVQNTAIVQLQTLTLSGNLIANAVNQGIFVDKFTANMATFSQDLTVFGTLRANTALGNVFFSNISSVTSTANSIQWYPQATSPTQTSGQVWYSSNTISLVQDTDVPGDRPAISKVMFERVYNGTASTIPARSWVRLAGAVTSNSCPHITLADATSAANSQVEGLVKVAIPAGSYGFIYTRGIVSDFDVSAYGNIGELMFLSTTPGVASNVAPTGANSVVGVSKILSNGVSNGKIQIAISNQQAYGKANGAVLYANNNLIQASATATIDEANGTFYVPNGVVKNTRSLVGNQTAFNINFTTDTVVRANISGSNLVITPANFAPGKEVKVIVTNIAAGNRTITHGCSAVNSTGGATTYTLGATSSAVLTYTSFGFEIANTYVVGIV